jgi:Tfp pilus assembly protein PilO
MTDSLQSKVITGVVLLVACLGVGYFFTLPQWENYSANRALLIQKQAEGKKISDAMNSVESFVNSYAEQKADRATVALAMPTKNSDTPNLLQNVSELARLSGMSLMNLQIDETPQASGKTATDNTIQTQKITMMASGTYPSFRDFAFRLQNNMRIIDIDRVTAKADENLLIIYQINLRTYYQK